MGFAEAANRVQVMSLLGKIQQSVSGSKSYEEAAQRSMDVLHAEYETGLVLSRAYVTVPYSDLPARNKGSVDQLLADKGGTAKPTTPVLSLVGTRGIESKWNDRRTADGLIGIPLLSEAFIDGIPLVARLLRDISPDLSWVDASDSRIHVVRSEWSGLVHVEDAATTVDSKGRKLIVAQDIVEKYGVKSVFTVGGAYPSGHLFALIFFTNEDVPKTTAERFLPLTTAFKASTASLVAANQIFSR